MKKSTKNLLFLTSAVIAGMHIYNRVVDSNAERKNALKVDKMATTTNGKKEISFIQKPAPVSQYF